MLTKEDIEKRVNEALSGITDAPLLDAIRPLLVRPRCEHREWNYGEQGQTHPCWIVLDHPSSNTCMAYCEKGHGPTSPWGLLSTKGIYLNMGPDYQWFAYFDDAFRDSQAWDGENPPGYEVR